MRFGADDAWWWLWALPVIAAGLWVYASVRHKALVAQLGRHPLVQRLLARFNPEARLLKQLLTGLALCLMVFAFLRPQFGVQPRTLKRTGMDIAVAFDISKSMLARDVSPSRISAARSQLLTLIERLTGDRVALVPFAGVAFTQSPLTHDDSAIKLYMNSLDPQKMPVGGTHLAMAIRESLRLLTSVGDKADEGGQRSRVILLITDGEDVARDKGEAAQAAAKEAAEAGVRIFAVAVGTKLGEPIPIVAEDGTHAGYQKDSSGKPIYSQLNIELLEQLADLADPEAIDDPRVFQFDGSTPVADELIAALGTLQRAVMESSLRQAFGEKYQYILGPALLLLIAELWIRERRRQEVVS
ncbi:MAG: vWA domain-containing protein [Bradymonadia bacterium]